MIEAYIDGSYQQDRISSFGVVVYEGGERTYKARGFIGQKRSLNVNVAEYAGLIHVLKFLLVNPSFDPGAEIIVHSDSATIVEQMNGIHSADRRLYEASKREADKLVKKFDNIKFDWIPREQNKEAHKISQGM